jgi:hypothetical protein
MDRMRRRFRNMTESPLSTLWEIWRHEPGEDHGNSGYNHGWAGGPLVLLSEYVAGISPDAKPDSYTVAPTLADLNRLQTVFPTPKGLLRLRINREVSQTRIMLHVPAGTIVRVQLPAEGKQLHSITHNGRTVWVASANRLPDNWIELGPGEHMLTGEMKTVN